MFSSQHEPPKSLEEEIENVINHRSYFIGAINLSALLFQLKYTGHATEGRLQEKVIRPFRKPTHVPFSYSWKRPPVEKLLHGA